MEEYYADATYNVALQRATCYISFSHSLPFMRILFIGDIVGSPGLNCVLTLLAGVVEKHKIDFVIANGENVEEGKSISDISAAKLFEAGVDVITGGNHTWDRWQIRALLAKEPRVLRPMNYPRENAGRGYYIAQAKNGKKVGVLNLQGRTYMQPIDDPFHVGDWALTKLEAETKIIIVDFHAEATAEKIALCWYLDGRVSAVLGTHTHTPTADARLFPRGTAFMCDVGMTGPYNSVIGMKVEPAIKRHMWQTPFKYEQADGDVHFASVILDVDEESGRARSIEPYFYPPFERTISSL